jgi:predicted metal-dependent hydrolase
MKPGNSIIYEGWTIPYDITYSHRRHSISIIVHRTKRVEIKAPSGTPASYIHGLAGKKVTWIVKRLMLLDSMAELPEERKYHEGEVFFFLGDPLLLSVTGEPVTGGIRCDEGHLVVNVPGSIPGPDCREYTRRRVLDWYRDQADRIISEKIQEFAVFLDIVPPPFRLRNARRRWGSCNHKNHLNFNIRLVMAPVSLIEYVVMHELCHIRHKNHSGEFWESLRHLMPDYRERRELLKREGHRYVL